MIDKEIKETGFELECPRCHGVYDVSVFDGKLCRFCVKELDLTRRRVEAPHRAMWARRDARQKKIRRMLMAGFRASTKIARLLGISHHTVRAYLKQMKAKGYDPVYTFIHENEAPHFCECGCGQEIELTESHYKRRLIPRYIKTHALNLKDRSNKLGRSEIMLVAALKDMSYAAAEEWLQKRAAAKIKALKEGVK